MSTADEVVEFGRRWAEAEQRGDTDTLATMVVDDFKLVGPAGFVLDRGQWIERYRSGELVTHELVWDQVDVREYGDAAVAVGVHTQRASYRGNPADGSFRGTHVVIRRDGRWVLAGIHLSPIGGPPPFARRAER